MIIGFVIGRHSSFSAYSTPTGPEAVVHIVVTVGRDGTKQRACLSEEAVHLGIPDFHEFPAPRLGFFAKRLNLPEITIQKNQRTVNTAPEIKQLTNCLESAL
jgi:hypothetical protein